MGMSQSWTAVRGLEPEGFLYSILRPIGRGPGDVGKPRRFPARLFGWE